MIVLPASTCLIRTEDGDHLVVTRLAGNLVQGILLQILSRDGNVPAALLSQEEADLIVRGTRPGAAGATLEAGVPYRLTIRPSNRGEPYREGFELSLLSLEDGLLQAEASIFLETQEVDDLVRHLELGGERDHRS